MMIQRFSSLSNSDRSYLPQNCRITYPTVLFAYGDTDRFRERLLQKEFVEEEFWFSWPHAHHYNQENDAELERLLNAEEWKHFPLQAGDEWS